MAIHGLCESLDHPSRRLLDVLHERSEIVEKIRVAVDEIPEFSTVFARKQRLKTSILRTSLKLSVEVHDLGDVQAIGATRVLPNEVRQGSSDEHREPGGIDRLASSRYNAKRRITRLRQ